ncbi:methyltransferase [Promethearchaeum syntrophicum]|uniref:Methyltransferase n=1 Tax=Promethearchaeum syntrophicum TaxID=2594042 RepID=A0A5B9DHJ0_9ARCH|nr:methyltransferase [Candidatus Prometheoarchaeum syntrophicum]
MTTLFWVILCLVINVGHQVYVLICWRIQLKSEWITRKFGKLGFNLYIFGFFILFFARFISIAMVSISNQNTLDINIVILRTLAIIISIPMIYLFYSVLRYFGIKRAAGADHFDISYRSKQLESRGMYRYFKNGMYIFGVLILWIPGLILASQSALLIALFTHIYIWVHYYTVEVPDMQIIYGI